MSNADDGRQPTIWTGCAQPLLALAIPVYFAIGGAFGEYRAWRDLGWASLFSPATQAYVAWYSLVWPFQFNNIGAIFDPNSAVFGFAVFDDGNATRMSGCTEVSTTGMQAASRLPNVTRTGGHTIREGRGESSRIFAVEFTSMEDCESEASRLARAITSGTVAYQDLYLLATSASP